MKQRFNIMNRKTGFCRIIYFVVVLCFFIEPALATSQIAFGESEVHYGVHDQPDLDVGHFSTTHSPFSIPLRPESEPLDENEVKADTDDELGKFFLTLSLRQKLDLVSENSLFLHLLLSCENREGVSLVILHHSWKSFLF
jgi:hypothetical protein